MSSSISGLKRRNVGGGGAAAAVTNTSSGTVTAAPAYLLIRKGTFLWHGTPPADPMKPVWYANPGAYPNKIGEDGGISFTLDYTTCPKTKNARILLQYAASRDIMARRCASKTEFKKLIESGVPACYATAEAEVVFAPGQAVNFLAFHGYLDTETGTFTQTGALPT